jgi:MYXO-CTERM domain-containing protein
MAEATGRSPRRQLGSNELAWLSAVLLGGALALAPSLASADVAGPPDPDAPSLCEPGQVKGVDCETSDGSSGTCVEPERLCSANSNGDPVYCYECEEDCSVAAAGSKAPFRPAGLGGAFALAVALLLVRRRRPW